MGLTTTPDLENYLHSQGMEYASVEPLNGGTANFVWRLTLPSGETRVAKHAEPYIKNNPAFAFNVDRMSFEGNALALLPQTLSTSTNLHQHPTHPNRPSVRIPTLHHFDPDAHILIMDDAGLQNLKAWYPNTPASTIPAVGAALGTWLAQLHHRTRNLRNADNITAKNIYRYAYSNLPSAFAKYGLDDALAREIDEEFGAKLATDDVCVCHGDFWTGNILVNEGEDGSTTLSVVDWEMTRRGTGATDVAQFAAEAYLLDYLCGGKGLTKAFLEAYVQAAREYEWVNEEFVRRLVVHFGVHVAFWPTRVEWCDEKQTGELVRLGREHLVSGRGADWEAVRQGPLAPVVVLLS